MASGILYKNMLADEKPLRILFATEYLPPFISGISNRCKNLINGYREEGHQVTVFSAKGTDCDVVVPSIANPFYNQQRTFILPPLSLLWDLLNFTKPIKYDIAHIVAPLCLSFLPILPLFWLRGVKIYVSYHVYLEYYRDHYVGNGSKWSSYLLNKLSEIVFPLFYYIPLTIFAEYVGIPSKTADYYVFDYSKRVHVLKSGMDTSVFTPSAASIQGQSPKKKSFDRILSASRESDYDVKSIRDLAGKGCERGPILVYCGRLAKEKNISFLIEAMKHPSLQDATLLIVGDGPLRAELEVLAVDAVGYSFVFSKNLDQDSDLDDYPESIDSAYSDSDSPLSKKRNKIIFAGMIYDESKVASFYAQADIFVSASASETFGFTVAEAMACGTPAVVVRSGAFPTVYKMIDDNMFEVGNIDDFARKCQSVYDKLEVASKDAREIAVKHFSIKSSVNDLLATYRWILNGCPT